MGENYLGRWILARKATDPLRSGQRGRLPVLAVQPNGKGKMAKGEVSRSDDETSGPGDENLGTFPFPPSPPRRDRRGRDRRPAPRSRRIVSVRAVNATTNPSARPDPAQGDGQTFRQHTCPARADMAGNWRSVQHESGSSEYLGVPIPTSIWGFGAAVGSARRCS